jgi:hypothetical protein
LRKEEGLRFEGEGNEFKRRREEWGWKKAAARDERQQSSHQNRKPGGEKMRYSIS